MGQSVGVSKTEVPEERYQLHVILLEVAPAPWRRLLNGTVQASVAKGRKNKYIFMMLCRNRHFRFFCRQGVLSFRGELWQLSRTLRTFGLVEAPPSCRHSFSWRALQRNVTRRSVASEVKQLSSMRPVRGALRAGA